MNSKNKLAEMPIRPLLYTMAVPLMLSLLIQSLYNIVDSIFVSRINEYALRAVSLAFPIQSLMIAVAVGTAVGINAFLSRTLGEKDFEKANIIARNGIFIAIASYIGFAVIGALISRPFFASQTEVMEVREYGVTYLTICCVAGMGIFLQTTFERLLQATGKTIYTMITQSTGAIINIILDPILIFGYFGMPRMGIAGAAVATVFGQIVAASMALWFNLKFNKELDISMKGFHPNGHLIGQIYKVGAPSIVVQAIGSLMTYGMNLILASFGSAQTVFGIYFKLQSFVFMPVFGLNNGMVPIIAYNYGAGHKDRVIRTIKHSVAYGVGIMCVGLIVMHIFPAQLMRMFDAEESLIAIGVPALETISLSFVFAGFCIVVGSVFQALGNGVYSMIVSVARQMCVLLPVAKLLSLSGEVTLIWWAFPIAELASLLLSTHFLVRIYKKIICHIGEPVTTREITE
jgi:putative MATE family efflux protein